ncbi:MAG: PD-(D/E)XK nuclease domain-containing protein [Oscillospiraceae bacterium]|nr:PD-(D/E)XK nuclease domain-containing protein [Oscillospiraceae bacterium]
MCTFESADDVLTLLIHLGYLTYDFDTKTAWIPNAEVQQEFINSIQDGGFENVMQAIHQSDKLLKYTMAQDAEKVAGLIADAHNDNLSVIRYNDENSLACVLTLAYYSAQDTYALYRELQGGEGFADLVFVPRRGNTNPAMIMELKWDKTAGIALEQIKDRQYVKCLKDYHGQVLFVGISYDKKSKRHECRFETIMK